MRQRIATWAERAHMTTGAFYVSVGLALLCSLLAGLNVTLWNTTRDQQQRLALLEVERDAEQTAARQAAIVEVKAQHARCIGSIRSTMIANTVIVEFKRFLIDTADDTEDLIRAEPDSPSTAVRQRIVRSRRAAAAALAPFPSVTKEACDRNGVTRLRELGVPLRGARKLLGLPDG